MIELLGDVDKPGVIECSCLLQGKEILTSSFPQDRKNHQTIAKQAFSYVFLNVAKVRSKHNEAHLEIGDKRLSGFLLKPGLILICLSAKDSNIANVRAHIHEIQHLFLKDQIDKMLA